MPIIGKGTWTLSDEEAENSTYYTLKSGMRLIDTARYYQNESGVGKGLASNNPHVITIEKMLEDMYCDKLIQSTYSKAEYPSVLEQVIKTHKVEKPKMIRYAGRRNKAAEIKKILAELD